MRQTLLLALFGTHLALGSVAAQECPAGRERSGDTGIRGVRCVGPAASCSINVASGDGGERRHLFAVEPIVTAVDSASAPRRPPAAPASHDFASTRPSCFSSAAKERCWSFA
jgi:hypothetical protein